MKETTKSFLNLLVIISLFVLISYVVQSNIANIKGYVNKDYFILFFIFIEVVATVVAPISAIPLLPLISQTYGWFIAGLASVIGWMIGAVIVFFISRRYGVPIVKKLIVLEKISEIESKIPEKNLFWSIVFLRMVFPVDVLSYVLGLFSRVKFGTYFWASLIGIIPFAFVLSYVGTMPVYYQIYSFMILALIIILFYLIYRKKFDV